MLALSDEAVTALRTVVTGADETCCGLRIMVEAADCAGPKYLMGVESEAMDGDTVLEFGALKLFIDIDSGPMLRGTRIDFVDTNGSAGFTFDNPNFPGLCHCGEAVCG